MFYISRRGIVIYYSKDKGADQLCSYCIHVADMSLCFLMTQLILLFIIPATVMWQSVLGADGDKKDGEKNSKPKSQSQDPKDPPTEGYSGTV